MKTRVGSLVGAIALGWVVLAGGFAWAEEPAAAEAIHIGSRLEMRPRALIPFLLEESTRRLTTA